MHPFGLTHVLRPHTHIRAEENQAGQKQEHDQHSRPRFQQDGQPVLVRNIHGRPSWVPATIVKSVGPVSFMVQTTTGLIWKRQLDHIRSRMWTSPVAVEPAARVKMKNLFLVLPLVPMLNQTPAVQMLSPPLEQKARTPVQALTQDLLAHAVTHQGTANRLTGLTLTTDFMWGGH